MAGRKPIFNREEQRKNQVVVPLSEKEKKKNKEAAKEMLWNIELSGSLRTEAFFDRKAVIVELKVEEDSPLSGRTLPEVKNFFDTDMLVVAVYRKKEIIIPNGNSSIQPGDTVVVVTDVNNVLNELDDIFIIS